MTYRVVQWATGGVGQAAIAGIASHPDLELCGCWVHSPDKAGQDAGALAGIEDTGVHATNSIEEILSLNANCALYSPLFPNEDEVVQLLAAGVSVVTPVGWFYPFKTLDTDAVQAACEEGNSALLGTGIHPGGFTERWPLQLASMQRATRYVRSEEFSDIRTYGAPDVVGEMMLFGKTPEEAKKSRMGAFLAGGFYQSIHMIADALKMRVDDTRALHEIGVATAPIESPIGQIAPGRVAAQRFVWQGLQGGEPVIEAIVNWFMGPSGFDRPWSFGERGPRYEAEVRGDPSLSAVFTGMHPHSVAAGLKRNEGIVATAMHCVNAIPYLCQADPGIRSYLDLPMICGRADPDLLS